MYSLPYRATNPQLVGQLAYLPITFPRPWKQVARLIGDDVCLRPWSKSTGI